MLLRPIPCLVIYHLISLYNHPYVKSLTNQALSILFQLSRPYFCFSYESRKFGFKQYPFGIALQQTLPYGFASLRNRPIDGHAAPPPIGLFRTDKEQINACVLVFVLRLVHHLQIVLRVESSQGGGRKPPEILEAGGLMLRLGKRYDTDHHVPAYSAQSMKGLSHIKDMLQGGMVETYIETTQKIPWRIFGQIEEDFTLIAGQPSLSRIVCYRVRSCIHKVGPIVPPLLISVIPSRNMGDFSVKEGGQMLKPPVGPDARQPVPSIDEHRRTPVCAQKVAQRQSD